MKKVITHSIFNRLSLIVVSVAILSFLSSCEKDSTESSEFKTLPIEKSKSIMMPGPAQMLASGLQGASGSTVGPDGALYVTEGLAGKI